MGRYETLCCDHCGKQRREGDALNWIETRIAGLDVRTTSDFFPADGFFCGTECVAAFFCSGMSAKESGGSPLAEDALSLFMAVTGETYIATAHNRLLCAIGLLLLERHPGDEGLKKKIADLQEVLAHGEWAHLHSG